LVTVVTVKNPYVNKYIVKCIYKGIYGCIHTLKRIFARIGKLVLLLIPQKSGGHI